MSPKRRVVRSIDGPVRPRKVTVPRPAAELPVAAATGDVVPNFEPITPEVVAVAQAPAPMEAVATPKRRRFRFLPKLQWPKTVKGWMKLVGFTLLGLIIATVLYFGIKVFLAAHQIITRNNDAGAPALNGNLNLSSLKTEGDGRINILLLGIGGPGHDGAYLSDTMMVASIDPKTKDVAILSVPRDLYVPIPGYGWAKINAADAYGESQKAGNGPELSKQVVQKILDVPIQYYAQVDFTGFKQAVDAVGGIDIDVTQSLYDPTYPCDYNQGLECGFSLAAGQTHMNGTLALKYARCRKGNCGNDFGRAARQQQVLVALRQKALSLGTLTNPLKISNLIDIIGNSARTDLQLSDIEKLAGIVKNIDPSKITTKVIDEDTTGLVKSVTDPVAGDILVPTAGSGNFTQIQNFAHSFFVDNYIKSETANASIEVENGTSQAGLAQTVTDLLKGYGYNVVQTTNADNGNYSKTEIFDYTQGKAPYTINYLQNRFGVTAQKASPPTPTSPKIVIILGSDYQAK